MCNNEEAEINIRFTHILEIKSHPNPITKALVKKKIGRKWKKCGKKCGKMRKNALFFKNLKNAEKMRKNAEKCGAHFFPPPASP